MLEMVECLSDAGWDLDAQTFLTMFRTGLVCFTPPREEGLSFLESISLSQISSGFSLLGNLLSRLAINLAWVTGVVLLIGTLMLLS